MFENSTLGLPTALSEALSRGRNGIEICQRLWQMEGITNARELGGLMGTDGRRIKHGRLFRTSLLSYASETDMHYLSNELHIGCIIDLRTTYEVGKVPDKQVERAEYVNMPIMDKRNNMWMEMAKLPGTEPERLQKFARTDMAKKMTRHMYVGFVCDEFCQLQFAAFLNLLLRQNSDKNILWHCSQGKDRTGLITAFLLFALGCDRQTVVEDFALTNLYYQDLIEVALETLYANGGNNDDATVIEAMLGVRVDYFEAALDHIDREFGSMDNYLHDILLFNKQDCKKLQNIYLE